MKLGETQKIRCERRKTFAWLPVCCENTGRYVWLEWVITQDVLRTGPWTEYRTTYEEIV